PAADCGTAGGGGEFLFALSPSDLPPQPEITDSPPPDQAPTAESFSTGAQKNAGTAIDVFKDAAHASDPDAGDQLSFACLGTPSNGSVTDNGDGTVTYTPDQDFTGTDSFTYAVQDSSG